MEQFIEIVKTILEKYPVILWLFFFSPAYVSFAKQNLSSHLFIIVGIICLALRQYSLITVPILITCINLMVALHIKKPETRKFGFFKDWVIHPIEAFFGYLFFTVIRLIPIKAASAAGKWLGRFAYYFMFRRNKIAAVNLKIAFPKLSEAKRKQILKKCWENFGRTVFEVPHLRFFVNNPKYLKLENEKYLNTLPNKRFIAIFGHFNSLGLISLPFSDYGAPIGIIYRAPNNPISNDLIQKSFGKDANSVEFMPKGRLGIQQAMEFLKIGHPIAIAPDQYFSQGKPLTFFGKKAMTSVVPVKLATHFNCPVVPLQIVREKGIQHKLIIHKPIHFKGSSEKEQNENMQKINDMLESWIKENPDQWMWFHHRWGKNI